MSFNSYPHHPLADAADVAEAIGKAIGVGVIGQFLPGILPGNTPYGQTPYSTPYGGQAPYPCPAGYYSGPYGQCVSLTPVTQWYENPIVWIAGAVGIFLLFKLTK